MQKLFNIIKATSNYRYNIEFENMIMRISTILLCSLQGFNYLEEADTNHTNYNILMP
jgi:hypothetical protein